MLLTVGKLQILIDDADATLVCSVRWHDNSKGYAYTNLPGGKRIYMHRLIMGAPKGVYVDHINGNSCDNRQENLRFCTHQQNMCNVKKPKDNTSGFKGVSKKRDKWRAYIRPNGRQYSLGSYTTREEAAAAYDAEAKRVFGEFARTNG